MKSIGFVMKELLGRMKKWDYFMIPFFAVTVLNKEASLAVLVCLFMHYLLKQDFTK